MIVTLDFICLRLNPKTWFPEVLLLRRDKEPEAGKFALVGGWVREESLAGSPGDQALEDAVTRILNTKVGALPSYIERLAAEGSLTRDPALGWSVTIPHLCPFNRTENESLGDREDVKWVCLKDIIGGEFALPFDHQALVCKAYEAFVNKIKYSSLLLYLLPEPVAVSQIVDAYDAMGVRVTKQTVFSRWVKPELLVETGERQSLARKGQASKLYQLKEDGLTYFDSEIGKRYKQLG